MKRLSLLVTFFYLCTFCQPPQVKAAIPLAVVGAAAIGLSLGSVASTHYSTNPTGSWSIDSSKITAPITVYNQLLIGGAKVAVGYTANATFNLVKAYNDKVFAGYNHIQSIINATFPSSSTPVVGYISQVPNSSIIAKLTGTDITSGYPYYGASGDVTSPKYNAVALSHEENGIRYYRQDYWVFDGTRRSDGMPQGWWHRNVYSQPVYTPYTPNDINLPSGAPDTLSDNDAEKLKQNLTTAAAADANVRNELDQVAANNPSLVSKPAALTVEDVKAYAQQAAVEAQQQLVDQLNSLVSANPTNATVAAELAKAQAELAKLQAEQAGEQAEEIEEETFSPLTPSAFDTAYNPGEFDIPARFTSFLQNVKSSGLFSFSSSFFNSLPSGGSPIYTVEAGIYGHHTIDLSQTMSAGLAVLKSILLACFGFLSIRAVIMKR